MITEIHLSRNEKIWISMMPSQNTGSDTNSDGIDWMAVRSHAKGASVARKARPSAR